MFTLAGRRIYVAGHRGMVGSALVRRLEREGCEILTAGRRIVDLRRQGETEAWLAATRPEAVFAAASWRARIGLREGLQDAYRWFLANLAERIAAAE